MSQADEILDSLTDEEISSYAVNPMIEEHIIIGNDRNITIPESLQRIAVQYDHNIETVTFDCPRYWDNTDLSELYIYINYLTPNNAKGRYLVKNVRVDKTDSNLIHFDWVITKEVTLYNGTLQFLVCAIKTDSEANEEIHWNTEINNEMRISTGLECADAVLEDHPDIINDIFTRLDTIIADNKEIVNNTEEIVKNNEDMLNRREEILTRIDEGLLEEVDDLSAKITELKTENSRLRNDINSFPTIAATGETITIEGASEARFKKFKMDGNSHQETRSGKNLLPVDENLSINATKGYDVNIPAGTYIVSLTSETHSGDQKPYLRFYTNDVWVVLDPSNGERTVTISQDETTIYLYPYGMSASESDGVTLTVKQLMISAEGGEYEAYGTTPSPDFPSEVKSVGDNGELKTVVCSKNLLRESAIPKSLTYSGITCDYEGDGIFHIYGTYDKTNQSIQFATTYLNIPINKNDNYTLSAKLLEGTVPINFHPYIGTGSDKTPHMNWLAVAIKPETKVGEVISFTQKAIYYLEDATKISRFWIYTHTGNMIDFTVDFRVQVWLEKGDSSTEFESCKETSLILPLTDPLRSLPGNIRDTIESDGIHRRVGVKVLDGSEAWIAGASQDLTNTNLFYHLINDQSRKYGMNTTPALCNYLETRFVWGRDFEGACIQSNNGALMIRINKDRLEENTVNGFKAWLSSNNVKFYYELEEIIEPFTEEQQVVYNKIKNELKSYKGTTNIYSTNDISPIFDIEVLKDQQTENEKLQAQINEIKQQLSMT